MAFIEFSLTSSRGDTDIHCVGWTVDDPVATLQISHGMIEHILRYTDFAKYLNSNRISVFGHDHLGHGGTSPDDLGTIAESDGDEHLVEDLYLVTREIDRRCPGIPHFILGHSMGSFVVRRYLTRYGEMVDGAVIVGTGNQSPLSVSFGKLVATILVKTKGPRYVSPFLNRTVLEGNDKAFDEPALPNRWISRDEETVKAYNADPYSSFKFTVSGFRDLFTLIGKVVRCEDIEGIPKGLPIILLSGSDDPVGERGKGVRRAEKNLEKAGMHPDMILYEGGRHEILNETNRDEVYKDILYWLKDHISDRSAPHRREAVARSAAVGAVMPLLRPDPLVPIAFDHQVGALESGLREGFPYGFGAVAVDPCHGNGAIASVFPESGDAGLAEHPSDAFAARIRGYRYGIDETYP